MDGPAFPTDWPRDRHGAPASAGRAAAAPGGGVRPFGKDGFSFWDLVDIINPLQHIPVVSTIYRKISGDVLDALPRLAGGALFGGIAGAVSAVVNLVVKEATGEDIGGNVLALLGDRLGFSGGTRSGDETAPATGPQMLAESPAAAPEAPGPVFSAGWHAAMAMAYCDAECLDPRRSFFSDAARLAGLRTGGTASLAESREPEDRAAAARYAGARYAEATGLAAAGGRRLDIHG